MLEPHNLYYFKLLHFLKRFEVHSPREADYFFVPVNLIKFQFDKTFRDPKEYIESLPYLGQKPHLLFASGDFGQRKKSPYESHAPDRAYPEIYSWLDNRFTLLAFESTDDLNFQDIALLPYVLQKRGFFSSMWPKRRTRDLLFSFVGQMSYKELSKEHIRGGRLYSLKGQSDTFVGSLEESRERFGKREGQFVEMFERSLFSLCPAGYGRWTFRLCEALKYGAIPVILADGYKLPFASSIPWAKISLVRPENTLLEVPNYLRSIPKKEIALYQENLRTFAPFFTEEGAHSLISKHLISQKI